MTENPPQPFTQFDIKNTDNLTKLHKLCALNRFKRLDNLPGINGKQGPYYIMLAVNPAITDIQTSPNTVDIGLLKIHYLVSLNMPCGFLFEMPRFRLRLGPNYIKLYKKDLYSKEQFNNVKVVFANKNFTVFGSKDQVLLITLNANNYIKNADR